MFRCLFECDLASSIKIYEETAPNTNSSLSFLACPRACAPHTTRAKKGYWNSVKNDKLGKRLLTQERHSAFDPMLGGLSAGDTHGDDKVGRPPRCAEDAESFARFVNGARVVVAVLGQLRFFHRLEPHRRHYAVQLAFHWLGNIAVFEARTI